MNAILTQEFKNLVQQKGLVDTGALLNTVVVNSRLQGSELILDIVGVDYLPYVIAEYNLIEEWQVKDLVADEISTLISPIIEKMVQDALDGVPNDGEISITVLINGV